MSTFDKDFADRIIAGNGWIDGNSDNSLGDNPRCLKVTKYRNAWGGDAYGCVFEGDQLDKYDHHTDFVRNPEVYWTAQPLETKAPDAPLVPKGVPLASGIEYKLGTKASFVEVVGRDGKLQAAVEAEGHDLKVYVSADGVWLKFGDSAVVHTSLIALGHGPVHESIGLWAGKLWADEAAKEIPE